MSTCSNCGWEKSPNDLTSLRVVTQLGTPQEIAVCNQCIDYCTPDDPTEMFTLENTGQAVRWQYWTCDECDGVYDALTMKKVPSADHEDESCWVCPGCTRKLREVSQ
jgi:hypothetical protein